MLWVLERGERRAMKNIHPAGQRVEIYQGGERSKLGRHNRQRRQKEGGRSWGGGRIDDPPPYCCNDVKHDGCSVILGAPHLTNDATHDWQQSHVISVREEFDFCLLCSAVPPAFFS